MPLPVIDTAQMRDWEQRTWAAGISQEKVIQLAGQAFAEIVLQTIPPGTHLLILAGRGHNGDDARAAIPSFHQQQVTLINVNDPGAELVKIKEWLNSHCPSNTRVIDGLFGIGLNRPLTGDWADLVNAVNCSNIPVLSVDVPSGLNPDSGEPMGTAICASVTVTFGAPKIGLVKTSAAKYVGKLMIAPDIGLVSCPVQESEQWWSTDDDFKNYPPQRSIASHKGTYGHVGILAGSLGYHGAAVLAAKGAQCAQPGLITLITPQDVYVPIAGQLASTMVHPWESDAWRKNDFTAVLFGPGLAHPNLPPEMKAQALSYWTHAPFPVIADASGLDWLPQSKVPLPGMRIITPHPGEAARMLGCKTTEIQENRPSAVRALSRNYGGCWVNLKGHLSLMGNESSNLFINTTGNPHMAQGGAGDILAGLIAGLIAQPYLQENMPRALRLAAWRHGKAADALLENGIHFDMTDLLEQLKLACYRGSD